MFGTGGSSRPVHGSCQRPHSWCDIFEPLIFIKKIHLEEPCIINQTETCSGLWEFETFYHLSWFWQECVCNTFYDQVHWSSTFTGVKKFRRRCALGAVYRCELETLRTCYQSFREEKWDRGPDTKLCPLPP